MDYLYHSNEGRKLKKNKKKKKKKLEKDYYGWAVLCDWMKQEGFWNSLYILGSMIIVTASILYVFIDLLIWLWDFISHQ